MKVNLYLNFRFITRLRILLPEDHVARMAPLKKLKILVVSFQVEHY